MPAAREENPCKPTLAVATVPIFRDHDESRGPARMQGYCDSAWAVFEY